MPELPPSLRSPLGAARQLVTQRRAAPGAVVLGYHDVSADRDGEAADRYTVSAARLDAQLGLVARLGLRFVAVGEFVDRLARRRSVDGLAVVTFDDALDGVHRHGLDVLARHGVPATVFAVSERLGAAAPWWPEVSPVMSSTQLGEVAAAGHDIGSHTRTHRSLATLAADAGAPRDELRDELAGSRRDLEALVDRPVDTLAYPSGHHDPTVRAVAVDAGYVAAFTFLNGRVTGGEDRWRLPRLTMGAHLDGPRLGYHLLRAATSWPDHQVERVTAERV